MSWRQQVIICLGSNPLRFSTSDSSSMEAPNKKSHCEKEIELDRISDLPVNVTDQILSCLSIRESAKTSLLSTKWRHKWESVLILVFDNKFFSAATVDKLVTEIHRVLMLHVGPVHKFELSHSQNLPSKEIDSWILYLSRRSVKDLVLKIPKPGYYQTPACFFSCQRLMLLEISYCVLAPPSTFKGFKNLMSLSLKNVTVAQNVLENLISSSPVLENLALTDLDGVNHLKINAPNLRSFKFDRPFCIVSLENTPRLVVISIFTTTSHDINDQNRHIGNDSNLLNLMGEMPQLGSLTIGGYYLMYLGEGDIPKELPIRYTNLTHLSIAINLSVCDEISTFLCLLRSFPNLQELDIECFWEKIEESFMYIWDANDWNFSLSHLRLVEMISFCGAQDEIEFIKFMLLISPALKRIMVKPDSNDENWCRSGDKEKFEMVKKMLCFKRASAEAEIIFSEHEPEAQTI